MDDSHCSTDQPPSTRLRTSSLDRSLAIANETDRVVESITKRRGVSVARHAEVNRNRSGKPSKAPAKEKSWPTSAGQQQSMSPQQQSLPRLSHATIQPSTEHNSHGAPKAPSATKAGRGHFIAVFPGSAALKAQTCCRLVRKLHQMCAGWARAHAC